MALLVWGQVSDRGLAELVALDAEEGERGHVGVVLAVDAFEDVVRVADVVLDVVEREEFEVADASVPVRESGERLSSARKRAFGESRAEARNEADERR